MAENVAEKKALPEGRPYEVIKKLYDQLPPSVPGVAQVVKELPDDTQIVIAKYNSVEHGGTEEELDTFNVSISHQDQGASFVLTQNGLVNLTTGKQREVSLRSLLYPRPTEKLRIEYTDEAEERKPRTPLQAFRAAAGPLAEWVTKIYASQQYMPPPISIVEK